MSKTRCPNDEVADACGVCGGENIDECPGQYENKFNAPCRGPAIKEFGDTSWQAAIFSTTLKGCMKKCDDANIGNYEGGIGTKCRAFEFAGLPTGAKSSVNSSVVGQCMLFPAKPNAITEGPTGATLQAGSGHPYDNCGLQCWALTTNTGGPNVDPNYPSNAPGGVLAGSTLGCPGCCISK